MKNLVYFREIGKVSAGDFNRKNAIFVRYNQTSADDFFKRHKKHQITRFEEVPR